MQGVAVADRELLDAESLVRHLVPAGSVFAFLADHRGVLFPDGMFADLFGSATGRPSVPADVVASVIVLQSLQGLSDREAVEALTGVLAGKSRRALDSTILDDAVATQDTVTQLIGAIRRVARVVPGAAEVIA